jgi:hypothetical protein
VDTFRLREGASRDKLFRTHVDYAHVVAAVATIRFLRGALAGAQPELDRGLTAAEELLTTAGTEHALEQFGGVIEAPALGKALSALDEPAYNAGRAEAASYLTAGGVSPERAAAVAETIEQRVVSTLRR